MRPWRAPRRRSRGCWCPRARRCPARSRVRIRSMGLLLLQQTEPLGNHCRIQCVVIICSSAHHADLNAHRAGLGAECARLRGQWPDIRKAACEAASAVLEAVPEGALQAELLPGVPLRWSQEYACC